MQTLARHWWVLTVRGGLAIIFGLFAFLWPGLTLTALVLVFGAFTVADGIVSLAGAIQPTAGESRWLHVIIGILSLAAGIFVLARPALAALVLLYLIAAWAIGVGIATVIAAIALRKFIHGEWLLATSGILAILLGILLFAQPAAGAIGMVWAIALYAIVGGATLIALGVRLRSWARDHGLLA